MTRKELVEMLDPLQFRATLDKAKIPEASKLAIIRDRSEWLWDRYKPDDMEWHRKMYGKKER